MNKMFEVLNTPGASIRSQDQNVNDICYEFIKRSDHGFTKYGVTTERNDLSFEQWIQHLKEELMDAVVYIHRIQKDIKNGKDDGK